MNESVLIPGEPCVVMHRDIPGNHVTTGDTCWCRPVEGSALSDESLTEKANECDG